MRILLLLLLGVLTASGGSKTFTIKGHNSGGDVSGVSFYAQYNLDSGGWTYHGSPWNNPTAGSDITFSPPLTASGSSIVFRLLRDFGGSVEYTSATETIDSGSKDVVLYIGGAAPPTNGYAAYHVQWTNTSDAWAMFGYYLLGSNGVEYVSGDTASVVGPGRPVDMWITNQGFGGQLRWGDARDGGAEDGGSYGTWYPTDTPPGSGYGAGSQQSVPIVSAGTYLSGTNATANALVIGAATLGALGGIQNAIERSGTNSAGGTNVSDAGTHAALSWETNRLTVGDSNSTWAGGQWLSWGSNAISNASSSALTAGLNPGTNDVGTGALASVRSGIMGLDLAPSSPLGLGVNLLPGVSNFWNLSEVLSLEPLELLVPGWKAFVRLLVLWGFLCYVVCWYWGLIRERLIEMFTIPQQQTSGAAAGVISQIPGVTLGLKAALAVALVSICVFIPSVAVASLSTSLTVVDYGSVSTALGTSGSGGWVAATPTPVRHLLYVVESWFPALELVFISLNALICKLTLDAGVATSVAVMKLVNL